MMHDLTLYIANLPPEIGVILVVVAPTFVSILGVLVARKIFGYEKLAANNEVAGFIFAIVGLFYALLLTFATLSAWDKFSEAQVAVVEEAGAASSIYRLIRNSDPGALSVHEKMNKYLALVIEKDWPSMALGKMDSDVTEALNELYSTAIQYTNTTKKSPSITIELFKQLDNIVKARRTRIHLSTGIIPTMMWRTLFAGGMLTICYTYLFFTKSGVAQMIMVGILASLIFMNIFLIIQFNYPFSGEISIERFPLQETFKMFNEHIVQ